MQGLVQRLRAIGNPHPVIGVSGGLDSTHALLVCAEPWIGWGGLERICVHMHSFATSAHTKNNAIDCASTWGDV